MKSIVSKYFLIVSLLVFGSCVPRRVTPPKTQLQMREMQTRTYPQQDVKMVMKAVLNALQDEGYIIKNADKELGFISATKEIDVEDQRQAFFARLFDGAAARYKKNAVIDASANVTEIGRETRVRLVFQTKTQDNFGSPISAEQIEDTVFYQEFFTKVDKSLFFEKERI